MNSFIKGIFHKVRNLFDTAVHIPDMEASGSRGSWLGVRTLTIAVILDTEGNIEEFERRANYRPRVALVFWDLHAVRDFGLM